MPQSKNFQALQETLCKKSPAMINNRLSCFLSSLCLEILNFWHTTLYPHLVSYGDSLRIAMTDTTFAFRSLVTVSSLLQLETTNRSSFRSFLFLHYSHFYKVAPSINSPEDHHPLSLTLGSVNAWTNLRNHQETHHPKHSYQFFLSFLQFLSK